MFGNFRPEIRDSPDGRPSASRTFYVTTQVNKANTLPRLPCLVLRTGERLAAKDARLSLFHFRASFAFGSILKVCRFWVGRNGIFCGGRADFGGELGQESGGSKLGITIAIMPVRVHEESPQPSPKRRIT